MFKNFVNIKAGLTYYKKRIFEIKYTFFNISSPSKTKRITPSIRSQKKLFKGEWDYCLGHAAYSYAKYTQHSRMKPFSAPFNDRPGGQKARKERRTLACSARP